MSGYNKNNLGTLVGIGLLNVQFWYLVYLKLCVYTGMSWWWVTAPIWATVLVVMIAALFIMAAASDDPEDWDEF